GRCQAQLKCPARVIPIGPPAGVTGNRVSSGRSRLEKERSVGRFLSASHGALYGFLVAPACGFLLGFVFAMPTIDTPVRLGLEAALWGAVLFSILFGWLTAVIGMLLAALLCRRQ